MGIVKEETPCDSKTISPKKKCDDWHRDAKPVGHLKVFTYIQDSRREGNMDLERGENIFQNVIYQRLGAHMCHFSFFLSLKFSFFIFHIIFVYKVLQTDTLNNHTSVWFCSNYHVITLGAFINYVCVHEGDVFPSYVIILRDNLSLEIPYIKLAFKFGVLYIYLIHELYF